MQNNSCIQTLLDNIRFNVLLSKPLKLSRTHAISRPERNQCSTPPLDSRKRNRFVWGEEITMTHDRYNIKIVESNIDIADTLL